MHDTSARTSGYVTPRRTKVRRMLLATLLIVTIGGGLALIFAAYQHPALLLEFGNVLSCG